MPDQTIDHLAAERDALLDLTDRLKATEDATRADGYQAAPFYIKQGRQHLDHAILCLVNAITQRQMDEDAAQRFERMGKGGAL